MTPWKTLMTGLYGVGPLIVFACGDVKLGDCSAGGVADSSAVAVAAAMREVDRRDVGASLPRSVPESVVDVDRSETRAETRDEIGVVVALSVSLTATLLLRTTPVREAALEAGVEAEVDADADPVSEVDAERATPLSAVSADASPDARKMTTPTPSAAARPPTRPTYRAALIVFLRLRQ